MTPGSPPRVLALIPTWKAEGFLERTLDALAAQTCPGLAFLISDDASPDGSAAIAERRAADDPRFRVLRQPRNLGWVGNVNALLGEAAGRADYLLFAFQDDLPEPTYVEKCVAALEADPTAVMAFSDIRLIRQDGTVEERSYTKLDGVTDRIERARRIARHQGSWWIPNRGVFRASAGRDIGGLRRHRAGEFSADWPWLLEMSLLGGFVRVPERLVTKIYVPGSLSRTWRFGARQWAAAAESAMTAVSRRRLPGRDRLRLHGAIGGFVWKQLRRSARRRLGSGESDPETPAPHGLAGNRGSSPSSFPCTAASISWRARFSPFRTRRIARSSSSWRTMTPRRPSRFRPNRWGSKRVSCVSTPTGARVPPATRAGEWQLASTSPISTRTTSGPRGIWPCSSRRWPDRRSPVWPTAPPWRCAAGNRRRCGGGTTSPTPRSSRRFSGSVRGTRAPASGAETSWMRWADGCPRGTGKTTSTTLERAAWERS